MWKLFAVSALLVLVAFWLYPTDDKLETINGKRVLITGASKGIGEDLAYQFAKYGASTVITARRQQVLEKVVKKCQSIGSPDATHTAISGDMLDLNAISTLIDKSIKQLGGLDIVVLNHVEQYFMGPFDESLTARQNVYSTMDINFKSYIEITGIVLPHLTKTNGSLVILSSVLGIMPAPTLSPYTASKFALNGFFDSLRSQFIMEERNVSLTSCILGAIATVDPNDETEDPKHQRIRKQITQVPVEDTTLAIVKAAARRDDFVYYPPSMRFHMTFYKIFPYIYDYGLRQLYSVE